MTSSDLQGHLPIAAFSTPDFFAVQQTAVNNISTDSALRRYLGPHAVAELLVKYTRSRYSTMRDNERPVSVHRCSDKIQSSIVGRCEMPGATDSSAC